jgi:hypothetical protein
MTPIERNLCRRLSHGINHLAGGISKEVFLKSFPTAVVNGKVSTALLLEAARERSDEELACVLVIGFVFGFAPEQSEIFAPLIGADWHKSHEDIVETLKEIGRHDPNTLDALFEATQWVPKYLDYDDTRAFASKAIWAIGEFDGPEAESRLRELAQSDDPVLRSDAQQQLERQAERKSRQD